MPLRSTSCSPRTHLISNPKSCESWSRPDCPNFKVFKEIVEMSSIYMKLWLGFGRIIIIRTVVTVKSIMWRIRKFSKWKWAGASNLSSPSSSINSFFFIVSDEEDLSVPTSLLFFLSKTPSPNNSKPTQKSHQFPVQHWTFNIDPITNGWCKGTFCFFNTLKVSLTDLQSMECAVIFSKHEGLAA